MAMWYGCAGSMTRAGDCPVGCIPESEIYAAFVRMYSKLRLHEVGVSKIKIL